MACVSILAIKKPSKAERDYEPRKMCNKGGKRKMALKCKFLTSAAVFAVAGSMLAVSVAKAEELYDPWLRGISEGTPAGALPPPGVYGNLDNYWVDYTLHDDKGNSIPGTHLNLLVEAPAIIWVPNIKILGASYGAAILQPFVYNSYAPTQDQHSGAGNLGIFNTILVPGMLSWALPHDFFVRTGLTVYLNDASNSMADLHQGKLKNGGLPSGMGYTVVQPDLGLSWLHNGWNVSVNAHLDFPVQGDNVDNYHYRSGSQFATDYTITKTIGAWTVGVGGEIEGQFSKDTCGGSLCPYQGKVPSSIAHNYGVGPIVGYQFPGGMQVTALWNHNTSTISDVGGDFFDVRFTTPF
jgi:hypothetical protein